MVSGENACAGQRKNDGYIMGVPFKLFGFDVDVTVAWLVDPWKGGCHFVLTLGNVILTHRLCFHSIRFW